MFRSTVKATTAQDVPTSSDTQQRPEPEKPVKWLLGRQLLRSLKGILLYMAYGNQLDPRDWMQPAVFPKPKGPGCFEFWREQRLKREPPKAREDEVKKSRSEADYWEEKGGFWFDYISDTGDGTNATYSIAYLCLSDLYAPHTPKAGDEVKTRLKGRGSESDISLLPRGEFLFIGGDTAYHVS